MPVFNGGKYLDQAISSIRNQTFKEFELIILNDGSTDQSIELIKKHAAEDPRIVVIDRENRGLVESLNEGVRVAKGELIARMDADDVADNERLRLQFEFMSQHPEVVAVGSGYLLIDEDGDPIRSFRPPAENNILQLQALERSTPICHPTAVFRKNLFLSVGGYRHAAMLAEDLDLWLRMGEVGELANVQNILLEYRQHQASISESKQIEQLDVMTQVVRDAYIRRGIEVGKQLNEPLKPWRSMGSKDDDYAQLLKYGWWAYEGGFIQTSRKYALKTLLAKPLSKSSLIFLYCAWIRPAFER